MAWRIDEAVVRGEIDNRVRGRVTGRIWLMGRDDPVVLNLAGNAWRDVAGRVLTFVNPQPHEMNLLSLAAHQTGAVGDITASRKVKVPEIPLEEMGDPIWADKPFPWRWGNALYLEWFSERNGRVVIESAGFTLKLRGLAGWEMTEAEEADQREANGHAIQAFLERFSGVVSPEEREAVDDTEAPSEWNEEPTMTEEEAEAIQARQDLLLDRVQARLEREGADADYERILHEELERLRRERGELDVPADWERDEDWREAMERAAAELAENPDPVFEGGDGYAHPLVTRATDLFYGLRAQAKQGGWLVDDAQSEHPVAELINAIMAIGPKLAGALDGDRWPPELAVCALTLVRIKRARDYVDDAMRAAESCQEERLVKPIYLGPVVVELIDLADEIDQLVAELRDRLERDR